MKIPMTERRVLTKHFAREYQRSEKREKGKILDRFVEATGYHRVYAAWLLRSHGKRVWVKRGHAVEGDVTVGQRRKRPKEYGEEVKKALRRLWRCLDYPCGKRLVAAIPGVLEALERHGEIEVTPEVREKLLRISGATADRLLASERRKHALGGRSGTKPGSLLKSQIPVRTFADWNEKEPGFVEIDLVAHDGGCAAGDYVQTLDVTDVCTGWSEQRAVLNKAQVWVFEALLEIRERLPFPLHGVDSDNGSEFINRHLYKYCEENEITFTRARPYRKNDTCYVEQKNYSIVRRAVGYGRFVGKKAVRTLNELYEALRLRTNFFLPSMKLIEKRREGSRVKKRYEKPRTPYQRILDSADVAPAIKRTLKRKYKSLNPAAIERRIQRLQRRLTNLVQDSPGGGEPAGGDTAELQIPSSFAPRHAGLQSAADKAGCLNEGSARRPPSAQHVVSRGTSRRSPDTHSPDPVLPTRASAPYDAQKGGTLQKDFT
jgi:hypothetical protein